MFHWMDCYQSLKEHQYVDIKLDTICANKKSMVFTIQRIHIFNTHKKISKNDDFTENRTRMVTVLMSHSTTKL